MAFLIIFYLLNYTTPRNPKLYCKMKQKLAFYEVESTPKNEFSFYLITFHDNVSLLSIIVTFRVTTTQELVFEAKRLCQRIKHCFVVHILF